MTSNEAISFIKKHGVVLASAKGPAPRLTEAIVNGPIKGSWWAHPKSHQIFAVFQAVRHSKDILVCRLVGHYQRTHESTPPIIYPVYVFLGLVSAWQLLSFVIAMKLKSKLGGRIRTRAFGGFKCESRLSFTGTHRNSCGKVTLKGLKREV